MSDATSCDGGRDKRKSKLHEDIDIKKQSRKVGEKIRRDKLKSYLSVLAQEIPWISDANQKVDRSQILKLTVNYLRFHYGIKEKKISLQKWRPPSFLSSDILRHCLNEATGGFLMVVSHSGTVIYVSEGIAGALGHSPINIIGLPISSILHYNDCEMFSRQFRTADENPFLSESLSSHQTKAQNKQNTWLVAVGRLVKDRVMHELSVMGLDKMEWCTQHSMDGTIVFADQRVSQCLGLLSGEITGYTCYQYIVPEDVQAVSFSHMKIMTDDEAPQTIFRLKVPNQEARYIVSRSIIVRDKWTKKAKFISSINIIIEKSEGNQLLKEQQKKVEALIAVTKQLSLQNSDVPTRKDISCDDSRVSGSSVTSKSPAGSSGTSMSPAGSSGTSMSPARSSGISKSPASNAKISDYCAATDLGLKKSGTPLLKRLLGNDQTSSPNTPCTIVTEVCDSTSPLSSGYHSISSGGPFSANSASNVGNVSTNSDDSSLGKHDSPQIFRNEDSPLGFSGESLYVTNIKEHSHLNDEASNVDTLTENAPLGDHTDKMETSSNIDENQISTMEDELPCRQITSSLFSMQNVRNLTDSTEKEEEMDIARNADIEDSHEAYSSHHHITSTYKSPSDISDPSIQSFQPSSQFHKTCLHQQNKSQSFMTYSASPHIHKTYSVQSRSVNNQSLRQQHLACTPSSFSMETELSDSANQQSCSESRIFKSQSEQLSLHSPSHSQRSMKLDLNSTCVRYSEPYRLQGYSSQALPSPTYKETQNKDSMWSSQTHCYQPPSQESSAQFSSPSMMSSHHNSLHHQSKSSMKECSNQLPFEQARHAFNNVGVLSIAHRSPDRDKWGNFEETHLTQPSFSQQHSKRNSELLQGRHEQRNIDIGHEGKSETVPENAFSGEFGKIQGDSYPMGMEKESHTSVSESSGLKKAAKGESMKDVGKKDHNVYLKLAGQLRVKHKQMSQMLNSQESALCQIQENLNLVANAQAVNGHNGSRLHQHIRNLQASVQEQKNQLADLEYECMKRISDNI
ncbi:uncharacterized protein [Argopecten irradians]|uniref:uncharacterized protein isoform X2 n=1 Tax=Argopecten irradians TaxID=31199 RepID=UPI0037222154